MWVTDIRNAKISEQSSKPQGPPQAPPAKLRRRHWGIIFSFLVFVLAPTAAAVWYLETKAADQYASKVGFTVRTEETASALDLLGGLPGFSSASSSDTDILYEFIQSQALVSHIDTKLGLRDLYSKPEDDIIFSFDSSGSIEDLLRYWQRMVKVFYDPGTGLIELRVQAFAAEDAQNIAQEIFKESTVMINELSAIARSDATRYAKDELARAEDLLRDARQALTRFRSQNQIADPGAEISVQTGLLNALQQQLSDALIEQDLLLETTRDNDPRVVLAQRKIVVIEQRIAAERRKYGLGGGGEQEQDFSSLLEAFERLQVDLEFAQQSNLAARTAYDAAQIEAQRQSRYLAAYIHPTQPETAEYPKRILISLMVFVASLLLWSIAVLIYYSVKDRR